MSGGGKDLPLLFLVSFVSFYPHVWPLKRSSHFEYESSIWFVFNAVLSSKCKQFCVLTKHSWIVILMKVSYIPVILMSGICSILHQLKKKQKLVKDFCAKHPSGWLSCLIALANLQLAVSPTYHILKSLGNIENLFRSLEQIVSGMAYYW